MPGPNMGPQGMPPTENSGSMHAPISGMGAGPEGTMPGRIVPFGVTSMASSSQRVVPVAENQRSAPAAGSSSPVRPAPMASDAPAS